MPPADATSAPSPDATPGRRPAGQVETPRRGRLWTFVLIAGAVAGVVGWLAGEEVVRRVMVDLASLNQGGPVGGGSKIDAVNAAEARTATIAYAALGGSLGLALGLAGGLARRRVSAALSAAAAGAILGAVAAAVAAQVGVAAYFRAHDPTTQNLLAPLPYHGAIWSVVGAAAGTAFGLGFGALGNVGRCLVGGLLGGLAGATLYTVVGAIALPLGRTDEPIAATSAARLLARMAVALGVAAGAALAVTDEGRAPRP